VLGLGQCLVLRSLGLRRLGLRFVHRCGLLAELPGADHVPFVHGRSGAAPRLTYETAATRNLQPDALGTDPLAPASSAERGGPAVPAPDVERWVVLADAIVLRALRGLHGGELLDLNARVHGPPARVASVCPHARFQIRGDTHIQNAAVAITSHVHVPRRHHAPRRTLVRILVLLIKASLEAEAGYFRTKSPRRYRGRQRFGHLHRSCPSVPPRPARLVLRRSVPAVPPFRLQPRFSAVCASALRTSAGRVVLLFLTFPADMSGRAQGRVRQAAGGPSRHRATRGRRRTVDTLDNT
jgi:hypothetical protein